MKTRIVFSIISFLIFAIISSTEIVKNESPVGYVTVLSGSGLVRSSSGRTAEMYLHQPIYAGDEVMITGSGDVVIQTTNNHKSVYVNEKWNKYTDNPWISVNGLTLATQSN